MVDRTEYFKEYNKQYRNIHRKKLNSYTSNWQKENREKRNEYARNWKRKNKKHVSDKMYERKVNKPAQYMLYRSKERAKAYGFEFSLTLEDIQLTDVCPVLGIKLEYGSRKLVNGSPTIDRINNSKGYIPGNVKVISFRANSLKRDGTIDEIQLVLDYMRRETTD